MTRTTTHTAKTRPAAAETTLSVPNHLKLQGLTSEQFFYFFLRLRKGEVTRIVGRARKLYPDESPEQLARRLINAQSALSFLGGVLIHLPLLFPMANTVLKTAGMVGGASMLTRMHMYLILEIALLYGKDIDDPARVKEMIAVVAASGLAVGTPLLLQALAWAPAVAVPTSGLTTAVITRLIGESAIAHYSGEAVLEIENAPVSIPVPA